MKKYLLVTSLVTIGFVGVQALSNDAPASSSQTSSINQYKVKLQGIAQDLVTKQHIYNPKMIAFSQSISNMKEEDLIDMCDQMLIYQNDLGDKVVDIVAVKEELIKYMKSFVASEMDVAVDPNFAFFWNTQNPNITVKFVNPDGSIRTRRYALKINSFGLKFEIAVRLDGIMIVGSDFNYYDSANKEYDLGGGIDIGWFPNGKVWDLHCKAKQGLVKHASILKKVPFLGGYLEEKKEYHHIGLCLTTARIEGTNSHLVICGIAFGFGGSFTKTGLEGSYVFGGKMTPIEHTEQ
jgi:hypothetical protein